jgi:hypothetical protein
MSLVAAITVVLLAGAAHLLGATSWAYMLLALLAAPLGPIAAKLQRIGDADKERIRVGVTTTPDTIPASLDPSDFIAAWIDQERTDCLACLIPPPPKPPSTVPPVLAALEQQVMRATMGAMSQLNQIIPPDRRTEDEYRSEVNDYLKRSEVALRERYAQELLADGSRTVRLSITNESDERTLSRVRLVLTIPKDTSVSLFRAPKDDWAFIPGPPERVGGQKSRHRQAAGPRSSLQVTRRTR